MIVRQKIAVTGASGQLGQALKQLSDSYPQYQFIFLSSDDLDIREEPALKYFFSGEAPQYFINCAAYTAVDRAEEEKELAYAVNADAVKTIAGLCRQNNTQFIHISTDYVFDGLANAPYLEYAETNPVNVYGASKLKGEEWAIDENPEAVIIRTSWVYSPTGKNFVKTMLRLMHEKSELNIVNDQFGSPTYAADLAAVIMKIISPGQPEPGIYHFCNEGVISWFEFATAIRDYTGSKCLLHPVSTSAYPTIAQRPAYSALNTEKIRKVYGIIMIPWKESLERCIDQIHAITKSL